jgi:hypothetical protein
VSAAEPGGVRRVPPGGARGGTAAGFPAGAIAFALGGTTLLSSYEARTLDWRQRAFARPTAAVDKVAVVLLDDFSIEAAESVEGVEYPWARDFYEPIVFFLKEAGARAVVFDLYFADPSPGGAGGVFAAAAKSAGNVTFAAKLGSRPPKPKEAAAREGRVRVEGWTYPGRRGTSQISSRRSPTPAPPGRSASRTSSGPRQHGPAGRSPLPHPDPGTPRFPRLPGCPGVLGLEPRGVSQPGLEPPAPGPARCRRSYAIRYYGRADVSRGTRSRSFGLRRGNPEILSASTRPARTAWSSSGSTPKPRTSSPRQ